MRLSGRRGSKMKSNHYLRIAALAAVAASFGCGGNGTAQLPTGVVHFAGNTTIAATNTTPVVVPATGGVQTTTSSGTAVIPSGSVPPGTPIPANANLAIIPAGTGFIGTPSANSMTVNGVSDSGATLGGGGTLTVNVALPVDPGLTGTLYTLESPAEVLDTSRSLHVQTIRFKGKFYVQTSPFQIISPVPTALRGSLPNDGENAMGSFIDATFGVGNTGRTARLDIDYGNGFTLHQTQTIATEVDGLGHAHFHNFVPDSSNVPQSGLALVSFTIGDLP